MTPIGRPAICAVNGAPSARAACAPGEQASSWRSVNKNHTGAPSGRAASFKRVPRPRRRKSLFIPKAPARNASIVRRRICAVPRRSPPRGGWRGRPQGVVGALSRAIDRPRPALQRIEELGEGFPPRSIRPRGPRPECPRRPPSIPSARRDAAAKPTPQLLNIAVVTPCQHDGASSGSHIAMSVIIRVGVHPSGRHQERCRVDLPASRTVLAAHTYDRLAFDCQVPGKGVLPVPSMMVPPRMMIIVHGEYPGDRPRRPANITPDDDPRSRYPGLTPEPLATLTHFSLRQARPRLLRTGSK